MALNTSTPRRSFSKPEDTFLSFTRFYPEDRILPECQLPPILQVVPGSVGRSSFKVCPTFLQFLQALSYHRMLTLPPRALPSCEDWGPRVHHRVRSSRYASPKPPSFAFSIWLMSNFPPLLNVAHCVSRHTEGWRRFCPSPTFGLIICGAFH